MPFNQLKRTQMFRQNVKTWNKVKIGNIKDDIKKKNRKDIEVIQGNLMANPKKCTSHT